MAKTTVDESGAEVAAQPRGNLVPADRAAIQQAALALIQMIPDMPESDGAGILADILNAESPDDLNRGTKLPSGPDLAPCQLVITDVHKMPSDLAGDDDDTGVRLGHYLIIESTSGPYREPIRWQTSAPGLVLPIAKLYAWGKLPALVEIKESDKPTRRGFRPLNLTVVKAGL